MKVLLSLELKEFLYIFERFFLPSELMIPSTKVERCRLCLRDHLQLSVKKYLKKSELRANIFIE
ncbi:hypothetical protein [uncultured Ilyobacter sp.]|uniref:hypothetical protein n=1 Tax=uncultured Ilyobacter sp. TaxID=544433 RepID=UPI0029C617A5|nr:hypothetical protein [uncultured Ilyobacter sp.]